MDLLTVAVCQSKSSGLRGLVAVCQSRLMLEYVECTGLVGTVAVCQSRKLFVYKFLRKSGCMPVLLDSGCMPVLLLQDSVAVCQSRCRF